MESKGQAGGLAPTDINTNKVPVSFIPLTDMKAATSEYFPMSPLSFDNQQTGNNIPTNGPGNWFTLADMSYPYKEKGWATLSVQIGEIFYVNSLNSKTGTAYANQIRITLNGVVKEITSEIIAIGTSFSIQDIGTNEPINLKIEIKQPLGATQTHAYGSVRSQRNGVLEIVK